MPKRTDIKSILIIGAGPIVIGQACEFDYSGTQACKALKEEGYRIVLVNSNPATIMTDPDLADATYIEPITPDIVAQHHRDRAAGRAAAYHGRTDRAELRALAQENGRARTVQRADDRRDRGSHRQGGRPRAVPRGDAQDRAGDAALGACQRVGAQTRRPREACRRDRCGQGQEASARRGKEGAACLRGRLGRRRGRSQEEIYRARIDRGAGGADRDRIAGDHPAFVHARRHRRRHRLYARGVSGHHRARHRRLADQRSADRGIGARLEGIRDGSGPRQSGQLHHHLLDRERRSDGRAYRRLDHRGAGADPDG